MILKSISFNNFRNFSEKQFKINPHLTAIFGDNAKGKTNLLEGIYFILKGEGFRESREEQLIIFNEKNGYVDAKLEDSMTKDIHNLRINLTINYFGLNKTYFLEKTKKGRNSYLKDLITVVLFSPEQIEIIDRTMSFRREYFDKFLSAIDSEYKKHLHNYQQAVRKRNKILERHYNQTTLNKELDFWNNYLEKEGKYITDKRSAYVSFLNDNQHLDSKIFKIDYLKNEFNQERLKTVFEKEKLIRKTLIGPQKDDFRILINNNTLTKDVHHFGSRSEQRLTIFWLKINELKYFDENFQKKSLLLLDDIFSELDADNKKLIFSLITKYQTVATTTEDKLINKIKISKKIIQL
jgi:DNA replication and repair protein RecF